jgi:hypothetical protein
MFFIFRIKFFDVVETVEHCRIFKDVYPWLRKVSRL